MSHLRKVGRQYFGFGLLFTLLSLPLEIGADNHALPVAQIQLGDIDYRVEIAAVPAHRRQGLMYREQLARGRGMLLVYPNTGDHRIWMKNMRIPLRVFWIDESYIVIEGQRLEPCSASPCPIFSARLPSRFVLELGDFDHGLKAGDRIPDLANLRCLPAAC